MKYELRRPCNNCPFRTDVEPFITHGRARELVAALVRSEFTCHKTTVSVDDDEGGSSRIDGPNAQHCAGALIMLEHVNQPSQMMRICERIGMYDRSKLDMSSPVYTTPAAFIRAHRKNR